MSAPFSTLLLDVELWDLVVDSGGNIALAAPPYAVNQDVASACRTFLGECYYDTTQGVPYEQQILGKRPPLSVFQAAITAAAASVPGVKSAACVVSSFKNRQVVGQVQFSLENSTTGSVTL